MARKKSSKPVETSVSLPQFYINTTADWGGFINIKVTDDEKTAFEAWFVLHRQECLAALDDLMGEGMKIALSFDHENECYICSFTGRGWESSTHRWCMTTRAGTFDEVIGLALYKHWEIAQGSWGDYRPDGTKKPSWG